jgi:hypothetical protein
MNAVSPTLKKAIITLQALQSISSFALGGGRNTDVR